MTTSSPSEEIKKRFNELEIKFQELESSFRSSSQEQQNKNRNIVSSIGGLINFLRDILDLLDTANNNFLTSFDGLITFLLSIIEDVKSVITATDICPLSKYVLSVGGSRLDSIVYNPDKINFPETESCPVINVLVPILNADGTHIVTSSYDATNAVLNSSIDMELKESKILKDEYENNSANVERIIQSIIKSIIKQDNITEFTITGETSGKILSSNPSQPPSTYAYGAYKNLKTAITDKNIKLTLKIHNPTQAFKITHLINVPQTYTNSYAHKDLNYEKI